MIVIYPFDSTPHRFAVLKVTDHLIVQQGNNSLYRVTRYGSSLGSFPVLLSMTMTAAAILNVENLIVMVLSASGTAYKYKRSHASK